MNRLGLLLGAALLLPSLGCPRLVRRNAGLTPQDGTLRVPGIERRVNVDRDNYGIARIRARSDEDLGFALGWVHAQDRLFQLDWLRREAAGRLSEVNGERTLARDRFFRMLDLPGRCREALTHLDDSELRMLQRYADGVNALMSLAVEDLPPEFRILGYDPAEWQVQDSCLVVARLHWEMAGEIERELWTLEAARLSDWETVRYLMPIPEGNRQPAVRRDPYLERLPEIADIELIDELGDWREEGLLGAQRGSQAVMLTGQRKTGRGGLLAHNLWLPVSQPSWWHLAVTDRPGLELSGAFLAGTPFLLAGHTETVAFAPSVLQADQTDLYVLELNGDTYQFEDEWRPLVSRQEVIEVRGSTPDIYTIWESEHGPLLSRPDAPVAVAMRWAGDSEGSTLKSLFALNLADSAEVGMEAIRGAALPAYWAMVDDFGRIGLQGSGWIPRRERWSGQFPADGRVVDHTWTERIPVHELPRGYEPREAFLLHANQRPTEDELPSEVHLGNDFGATWRHERLEQLFDGLDTFDHDQLSSELRDRRSLQAEALLPELVRAPLMVPGAREVTHILRAWDRFVGVNSRGALYFEVLRGQLAHTALGDDLGPRLVDRLLRLDTQYATGLDLLFNDGRSPLWDDRITPIRENRPAQITLAMRRTELVVVERLGGMWSNQGWGRFHTAEIPHPLAPSGQSLSSWSSGPFPMAGDAHTVTFNPSGGGREQGVGAPLSLSLRIDTSAMRGATICLTTGNSGLPGNEHYDDMRQSWLEGREVPLHARRYSTTLQLMPLR